MARKKYQHYTDEFRRETVRRADQPGHTASSVAKELGIHPGQIYNWRRQFTRLSEKNSSIALTGWITPSRRVMREFNSEVRHSL